MKKILSFTAFLSAAMLLLPLCVFEAAEQTVKTEAKSPPSTEVLSLPEETEKFKVSDGGKVSELTAEEYILGVVAAEMPALYEEEALKAQAVAAYTFAVKRREENKDKDYDITSDYNIDQSYISRDKLKEKWGSNAEQYIEKIEAAVNETKGIIITYNGEPITAVYHAVSSGITEDAKNVWGKEIPYLKSVKSEGDKLADNYISTASFTEAELKEKLKGSVDLSGKPENYFKNPKKTAAGTVTEISVCGNTVSGFTLQKLLGLKSASYTVKYEKNKFTFTVCGYGHGVGMSQNGANYMAKNGSDYKEILNHYYKDCKIEKAKQS